MLLYKGKPKRKYISGVGWVFLNENSSETLLEIALKAGIQGIVEESEIQPQNRVENIDNSSLEP